MDRSHLQNLSISESSIDEPLKLDIINIDSVDQTSWDNFTDMYNESKHDLCINKQGKKTQDLFDEIFMDLRFIDTNYKIIYFHSKEKIVAFALINIDETNKIIDLTLLCGNRNKEIKYNNVNLGIYLLDYIYNQYNNDKYILKIRPSNDELKDYYIKWKKPSLNPNSKRYGTNNTHGYLIYGNLNLINKNNIEKILYDFSFLKNLLDILNISEYEFEEIEKNKRAFLINKIAESDLSDSQKDQLLTKLDNVYYFTLNDFLMDIHVAGGRRSKKSRRSKKTKRSRKLCKT